MSIFRENAIIAGYINSYCLVCECYFETEEQTFNHTKNEEHEKQLRAHPYLEKYGNNGIRKVKAGYFCGYCSILMATAAKVNLHIAEKIHYVNKGNTLLKQCGNNLTAFDDVLISDTAWHCIADDACAMCNAEFDDEDEHKTERAHLIKLMQNKVEFGNNNNLYRRIDKNYFQCLTCNSVLTNLDQHFDEEAHKLKYIQCQQDKKKYDLANPKVNIPKNETRNFETETNRDMKKDIVLVDKRIGNINTVDGTNPTEVNANKDVKETDNINVIAGSINRTEISSNKDVEMKKGREIIDNNLNSIPGTIISSNKDEKVNITTTTTLATDNVIKPTTGNITTTKAKKNKAVKAKSTNTKPKPQETNHAENTEPSKENEKPKETKTTNNKDTKKMETIAKSKVNASDPATYAKDNRVTYNPRNPNAICEACLKIFPSNLRSLEEHINGKYHINKTKPKPKPTKTKDKLSRRQIDNFVSKIRESHYGGICDILINEKYILTERSCHGILEDKETGKFTCAMCEVQLAECELEDHCDTGTHERAMRNAWVITDWKNEFIREIRRGVFHCGTCNVVLSSGSGALGLHVMSLQHSTALSVSKYKFNRMASSGPAMARPDLSHPVFHMFVNHIGL